MTTGPGLGYTECMIGHNAIPIILDIYSKGFHSFDVESDIDVLARGVLRLDREGSPAFCVYDDLLENRASDQVEWVAGAADIAPASSSPHIPAGAELNFVAWSVE